jgi:hypothetical protein
MGVWKAHHEEVQDEPGETLLALPDRSPAYLKTEVHSLQRYEEEPPFACFHLQA